ncbi:MAG TPA: hypothetical protein DCZ74_02500 [Treponema sp.]|nr:hypothetical protein [Treponema sp.]
MLMLNDFVYYMIYGSAILLYGVGLNKAVRSSKKPHNLLVDCIKMLITVLAASILTFLISSQLIKIGMTEIFPFVAVLMVLLVSVFMELVLRLQSRATISEYAVSVMCVLLSISESVSLFECILISTYSVLSCFVCIPFLYALRKRSEINRPNANMRNMSLLFISMAIIIIMVMAWNVSWLNPGVLK